MVALDYTTTGIALPPSAVSLLDDPPAGDWQYRLSVATTTQVVVASFQNVLLTARELANTD